MDCGQVFVSSKTMDMESDEVTIRPKARIVRGKRGLHQPPANTRDRNQVRLSSDSDDSKNESFNAMKHAHQSIIRKRRFDEMSAGSLKIAQWLRESPVVRIPNRSLFYVRVDKPNVSNPLNNHCRTQSSFFIQSKEQCTKRSRFESRNNHRVNDDAMDWTRTDEKKENKDELDNQLWIKVDFQGVLDTWVKVFPTLKAALYNDGYDWAKTHPHGRIHEYQLQCREGITVVNLSENFGVNKECVNKDLETCVQNYVSDHGYCGYVMQHHMVLYQPTRYWRLLDDDKKQGRSQSLISDLFHRQFNQLQK